MLRELLETLHANQLVITAKLNQLLTQETKMAVDLTALTAEVTNNTTVDGSIITLLDNIVTQLQAIEAGSGDAATQTALNALMATLQNNDASIAAAVVANTGSGAAASAAKPA